MTRRRVYLRGVGATTPLGASWPETAAALAEGRSAVRPIDHFDVRGFPCTVAAALQAVPLTEGDRRLPMALAAGREAWAQAGLTAEPSRMGVFVGAESGRPPLASVVAIARAAVPGEDGLSFDPVAIEHAAPGAALSVSPAAVTARLAAEIGARGPVTTVSLACASGAAAVAEAVRALRLGECDVALCGGVGADADPFMLAGFGLLGALSTHGVSRPFDLRRDGFCIGEGAAFLVLSTERGGAQVELAGIGRTLDAHHLTAPDPDGEGAAEAMRRALRDADVDRVEYVQAHGTSTPLNDAVEAKALRSVLGPSLAHARVASVKGALGHTIAAAGALGLLCAVEAVAQGTLLPTAGLTQPDPECELPHLMGRGLRGRVEAALANAFAFGGANCSIVVRRA